MFGFVKDTHADVLVLKGFMYQEQNSEKIYLAHR